MELTERRRPERGQAALREFPDGIEGYDYDWFAISRRQPPARGTVLTHWAGFAMILAAVCAVTYADLGPQAYQKRVDRLLASTGLEWVAGRLMALDDIVEQASGRVLSVLEDLDVGSA